MELRLVSMMMILPKEGLDIETLFPLPESMPLEKSILYNGADTTIAAYRCTVSWNTWYVDRDQDRKYSGHAYFHW
jgi:hypothetical protein